MTIRLDWRSAAMRALLTIALIAGLTACDGGLFGTGDGSDIGVDPADTGVGGSESDGIDPPTMEDPEEPTTSPDATDGAQDPDGDDGVSPDSDPATEVANTQGFDNTLATTDRTQPLLRAINATSALVTLQLNDDGDDIELPGGELSSDLDLSLGNNRLLARVRLNDQDTAASIDPLNAGASSLTTVVLRETGDRLSLIPLETDIRTSDANLARLRIVIAGRVDNASPDSTDESDAIAALSLVPIGTAGGNEALFEGLSFSDPASMYQDVSPGNYQLRSENGIVSESPLPLSASTVYTLILGVPALSTQLLVEDSAGMSR